MYSIVVCMYVCVQERDAAGLRPCDWGYRSRFNSPQLSAWGEAPPSRETRD